MAQGCLTARLRSTPRSSPKVTKMLRSRATIVSRSAATDAAAEEIRRGVDGTALAAVILRRQHAELPREPRRRGCFEARQNGPADRGGIGLAASSMERFQPAGDGLCVVVE